MLVQKSHQKTRIGAVPLCTPGEPYCRCGGKPRREESMYAFLPPTGSALSAVVSATGYAARRSAYRGAGRFARRGRFAAAAGIAPDQAHSCNSVQTKGFTRSPPPGGRIGAQPSKARLLARRVGKGEQCSPACTRRIAISTYKPKDSHRERQRAGERRECSRMPRRSIKAGILSTVPRKKWGFQGEKK